MKKRLLSILTLLTMIVSLFSPVVLAQDGLNESADNQTKSVEEAAQEEDIKDTELESSEAKDKELEKEAVVELEKLTIHDKDGNEIKKDNELIVKDDEELKIKAEGLANQNYQWQIFNPENTEENDKWVDIQDEMEETLKLSYTLIKNLLVEDATKIRVRSADDKERFSEFVKVTVIESQVEEEKDNSPTSEESEDEKIEIAENKTENEEPELGIYSIVINYIYEDGTQAAPSYTATVAKDTDFKRMVPSPEVQGYAPDKEEVEFAEDKVTENITKSVIYSPAEVKFTIKHLFQNVGDDGYTEGFELDGEMLVPKTEDKTGYTESAVGDNLAKEVKGFYALNHDETVKIAADDSTVIEIKYDREYYLMDFELDGGYGVEPIYARYQTPINKDELTPKKVGYDFVKWDKDIPKEMPVERYSHTAIWEAGKTTFTVQYMLEDPNNEDKYNYWGQREVEIKSGTTVTGEEYKNIQDIKQLDADEKYYSVYSKADKDVKVNGDGTTVVNVYYNRKEYTLKFYYAIEEVSKKVFSVIGGSTYFFGNDAEISEKDKSNPIKLLDQYLKKNGKPSAQRGVVNNKPVLNKNGSSKGYIEGFDESDNPKGFKYHYISINAKYGADLSDQWPVDVFESVKRTESGKIKTASFSAWNGEHNVKYTQENKGNQTIKGKYAKMDKNLLWDQKIEKMKGESNDVAYLGYWLNGAPNIGWSIPKLFRYHIRIPEIKVQNESTEYSEKDIYDTVDNSKPSEQTHPAVDGFTPKKYETTPLTEYNTGLYTEGHNMYFYYSRNTYKLELVNRNKIMEKIDTVEYEKPIKDLDLKGLTKENKYEPSYPSNLEADAYEFEGWYESPSPGTKDKKIDFDKFNMPSRSVRLYANWVKKKRTVKFYKTNEFKESEKIGDSLTVHHGISIKDSFKEDDIPKKPENGNYEFVGWFYKDKNDKERPFDLSMPVNMDLNLYAKWRSNKVMDVTIKYAVEKKDGTFEYIAEPTKDSALAGDTKTYQAKFGEKLKEGYREGYFPKTASRSITIDIDDESKNEYIFIYVEKKSVPYTVRYLEEGTNKVLAVEKYVENNKKAVVTEEYKRVNGYRPDAYQKRLILSAEGENILTFYYMKDNVHAPIKTTYYQQNMEGSGYTEIRSEENLFGKIDEFYRPTIISYNGFTLNKENSKFEEIKLTEDGYEFELRYDRNEYPYEFQFLEEETNKKLADIIEGTARYQAGVLGDAKDIPGYTVIAPITKNLRINIEEPDSHAKNNIHQFFYKENDVTLNYDIVGPKDSGYVTLKTETVKARTGVAEGSVANANKGYKFVGWFKDKDGEAMVDPKWTEGNEIVPTNGLEGVFKKATYYAKFEKDVADLTIKKTGAKDIDESQSFIFSVKGIDDNTKDIDLTVTIIGNDKLTIKDLPIGLYIVTEQTDWSWRYTTPAARGINLSKENKIHFENQRKNIKWLSGDSYRENVFE